MSLHALHEKRADDLLAVLDTIAMAGGSCTAEALMKLCVLHWGLPGSTFFVDLVESGIIRLHPGGYVQLTPFGVEMHAWLPTRHLDKGPGLA